MVDLKGFTRSLAAKKRQARLSWVSANHSLDDWRRSTAISSPACRQAGSVRNFVSLLTCSNPNKDNFNYLLSEICYVYFKKWWTLRDSNP